MRDTKKLEAFSKAKEKENKQMNLFRNLKQEMIQTQESVRLEEGGNVKKTKNKKSNEGFAESI